MIGLSYAAAAYFVAVFTGGPLNPCIAIMQSFYQRNYIKFNNQFLKYFQWDTNFDLTYEVKASTSFSKPYLSNTTTSFFAEPQSSLFDTEATQSRRLLADTSPTWYYYCFEYNAQFGSMLVYTFASLIGGFWAGLIHLFNEKKGRDRLKYIKKQ